MFTLVAYMQVDDDVPTHFEPLLGHLHDTQTDMTPLEPPPTWADVFGMLFVDSPGNHML